MKNNIKRHLLLTLFINTIFIVPAHSISPSTMASANLEKSINPKSQQQCEAAIQSLTALLNRDDFKSIDTQEELNRIIENFSPDQLTHIFNTMEKIDDLFYLQSLWATELMLAKKPDMIKKLLPFIKQKLLEKNKGLHLSSIILVIIKALPATATEFFSLFKQNLSILLDNDPNYYKSITLIIKNSPDVAQELALLALEEDYSPEDFYKWFQHTCGSEIFLKKLNSYHIPNDFNWLLKKLIYCELCPNNIINIIEQCPSLNHIKYYLKSFVKYSCDFQLQDPIIQKTAMAALNKEQELIAAGYIPFVHGRRRSYDFLTQLYMCLRTATSNQPASPDFIFTHLKNQTTDLKEQKNIRMQLLKEGNPFDSKHSLEGTQKRQNLLFLNHFIFGNAIKDLGSCSFLYMLYNTNAGKINITIEDIFKMFNLEKVYAKYTPWLLQLEKEYDAINCFGQMLQIGISPKKVIKSVYLTSSGGSKKSMVISGITTDKIDVILNELNKNPQDKAEFALINTFDKYGGLNEHDMKISILDPADYDPESLQKKILCNQKRDILFQEILQEIQRSK